MAQRRDQRIYSLTWGYGTRSDMCLWCMFSTPNAPRQAEVMQRLGRHVPVPHIVGIEPDASVLGSPFYLMRRVNGRTPSDVPSWHKRGWTAEVTADERETLCDNGLRALAAVQILIERGRLHPGAMPPVGGGSV